MLHRTVILRDLNDVGYPRVGYSSKLEELGSSVSIGIPVYNGENYISRALEAILSQSYQNFEVIISDNNSSDGTGLICREYVTRDKRIQYIKQETHIGLQANLEFVLKMAKGEYFMWNAADDWRTPGFIGENLSFLKSNSQYVGSTSPNCFEDEIHY